MNARTPEARAREEASPGPLARWFRGRMSELARACGRAKDPAEALALGRLFGTLAYVNDSGTYADDALVRAFADRFPWTAPPGPGDRGIVHVISDAYRSGGHTRLMERLARAHTPAADLVITRSTEVDFAGAHPGLFAALRDLSSLPATPRLEALSAELQHYRVIVLHLSEDDFVGAVAALRARRQGAQVLFVNHADHHFAYGRELADRVLQVSAYGAAMTRTHLPAAASAYVGIPLPGTPTAPASFPRGRVRVLSAGNSWKYRPCGGLSLPDVIEELLAARPDLSFTVIGVRAARDRWWWPLKARHPRRVRLHGLMPYAHYVEAMASADVLLDSYPISGGTAFPEAVWAGRFACALRSPLGGASPADALRVKGAAELLAAFAEPEAYRARLAALQPLLLETHGIVPVHRRFVAAIGGPGEALPFEADADLGFLARVWEARGRVRIPVLRNVEDGARAALARLFPVRGGHLDAIGRLRSLSCALRLEFVRI